MRSKRVRVDNRDTWYHCYNRIAGGVHERPFGHREKQKLISLAKRMSALYTIRIVAIQAMGNHFHALAQAPADEPSATETCRRFEAFFPGRTMVPDSHECRIWQGRCRDISWFMRHLQQMFSIWYNQTRPELRRGSLWASRFQSTILEGGEAVWRCWQYIENNPVRAGLCANSADYMYGSHGIWHGTGRHPFEANIRDYILPMLAQLIGTLTLGEIRAAMDQRLASKAGHPAASPSHWHALHRRVRMWTRGMVVGSRAFIHDVMQGYRQKSLIDRRLQRMSSSSPLEAWLCPADSYKS